MYNRLSSLLLANYLRLASLSLLGYFLVLIVAPFLPYGYVFVVESQHKEGWEASYIFDSIEMIALYCVALVPSLIYLLMRSTKFANAAYAAMFVAAGLYWLTAASSLAFISPDFVASWGTLVSFFVSPLLFFNFLMRHRALHSQQALAAHDQANIPPHGHTS